MSPIGEQRRGVLSAYKKSHRASGTATGTPVSKGKYGHGHDTAREKESEGRKHDAYRVAGTASLGTSRVIVSWAVLYRPLGSGPIGQLTRGGRRPLSAMATRVSMCGNLMLYRSFSMSQGGRMSGGNVEVTAAVAMVDGSTNEDRKDNKAS